MLSTVVARIGSRIPGIGSGVSSDTTIAVYSQAMPVTCAAVSITVHSAVAIARALIPAIRVSKRVQASASAARTSSHFSGVIRVAPLLR